MNMGRMKIETEQLAFVVPSRFVKAFCSFWQSSFAVYKGHLPESHIRKDGCFVLISIEAVEGFRRCFDGAYKPKIRVFE